MAIGNRALYLNTTGVYNIGIGTQALNSNTTGNYNTATGHTPTQLQQQHKRPCTHTTLIQRIHMHKHSHRAPQARQRPHS